MKRLDIPPPATLYVSLLGTKGASLLIRATWGLASAKVFDRDPLLLRELLLPDWEGDVMIVLKPLLNELWQAGGEARCFDYGDDGNWKPR